MKKYLFILIIAFSFLVNQKANSQTPYIATIQMFAGNFAPNGWAFCNGQLLPISQYDALFALIGTTYGGDGQTTFGLPDLRGRVPVGTGQGAGLSNITIGQMAGTESNTLTLNQLPVHNHLVNAVTTDGNQNSPTGNLPANTKVLDKEYSNATANTTMKTTMLNPAGQTNPVSVNNMQPYLSLNFVISLYGIFPSQN